MVDPYNPTQLDQLKTASMATTCAGTAVNGGAEPFCTASSGVFLKVDWCRYQGYPDTSAPTETRDTSGQKDFSCHFYLSKAMDGSVKEMLPFGETTHYCSGSPTSPSYDTDTTCTNSPIMLALSYILAINVKRATATGGSLPALRIELSLNAGVATPEAVLKAEYNGGTGGLQPLDIAFTPNMSGSACLLEPQVWQSAYVNAYTAAYDELISKVGATLGTGTYPSAITLVKVTPLNELTAEYDLPGPATITTIVGPTMAADVYDDVPLACSSVTVSGAQSWINAYYPSGGPTPTETEINVMEQTLGTVVGNIYGELRQIGETYAGISIGTNNSAAYPAINCGMTGGGNPAGTNSCAVQTSGDQWPKYYFIYHINEIFASSGTSVAQVAAQAATKAINPNYNFALTKANFYVNTTNLSNPTPSCSTFSQTYPAGDDCPAVSKASLSCNANNTVAANDGSFTLNSSSTAVQGIGTLIGIQTMVNLSNAYGMGTDYCTATGSAINLGNIFDFAIANGSHYIEITPDLAADTSCYGYMTTATSTLQTPPYSVCLY